MKKIELTDEEVEVLEGYIFRKMCNLENLDLTDCKCYKIFYSIRQKLTKEEN